MSIDISSLIKGRHGIAVLTGKLRWRNGILEQEMAYQDYEEGVCVASRAEWQPVPVIDDSSSPNDPKETK